MRKVIKQFPVVLLVAGLTVSLGLGASEAMACATCTQPPPIACKHKINPPDVFCADECINEYECTDAFCVTVSDECVCLD